MDSSMMRRPSMIARTLSAMKDEEPDEPHFKMSEMPPPVCKITPGMGAKKRVEKAISLEHQAKNCSVPSVQNLDELQEGVQATSGKILALRSNNGLLEMKMLVLTFTDDCHKQIRVNEKPRVKLTWNILDFEDASLTRVVGRTSKHALNYSIMYKVNVDEEFLVRLRKNAVSFKLYVIHDTYDEEVGRADLFLKDVACNDPGTRFTRTLKICNLDKGMLLSNTAVIKNVATLTISYKLSYDIAALQTEYKRVKKSSSSSSIKTEDGGSNITVSTSSKQLTTQRRQSSVGTFSNKPTGSEIVAFKDALNLVLSRNKTLRTTQSEISFELQDRTKWLHDESNWKRSLQEHAILSGKDPYKVEWRQWRDQNTAQVRMRVYRSNPQIFHQELVIEIVSLKLLPRTTVMRDPNVKQIYVEYAFLNFQGEEMETATVSKPGDGEEAVFNFVRRYPVDLKEDRANCNRLAQMIRNKEIIRFGVVSEPMLDLTQITQICEEVGNTEITLFQLVELEENEVVQTYPVMATKNPNETIGKLTLSFSGIQAVRKNALLILAPEDYLIIV